MMNEQKSWQCDVCGYIHEGPKPCDSCPICGVGPDQFTEVDVAPFEPKSGTRWKCNVCGYIHEGDVPPDVCPVCAVPKEHFSAIAEDVSQTSATGGRTRVVVVGGGIAGMTAAKGLVAAGGVEVTIISKEPERPYLRLNLSRYLAGEVTRDELFMEPASWFDENGVKYLIGEVVDIERNNHQVVLRQGDTIPYDKLILATGAHPFIPPIMGASKNGVFPFRSLADTDAMLALAKPGTRAVIIGGGLLGLEAAGALARQGCSATVLEGFEWLLPRQLPKPAGLLLADFLTQRKITPLCGVKVKEIQGDEHVQAVLLEDGRTVNADLVVISTGIRPNSFLARKAGLNVDKGVVVDNHLRTNDPDIYGAGDAVEHRGMVYGIWPVSYLQGNIAAANVLGQDRTFNTQPPSNRLKVLDVELFSIGQVNPEDGSYRVFEKQHDQVYRRIVVRDGKLKGAALFGDTTHANLLQEAIEAGTQLTQWPAIFDLFPTLRS